MRSVISLFIPRQAIKQVVVQPVETVRTVEPYKPLDWRVEASERLREEKRVAGGPERQRRINGLRSKMLRYGKA